MHEELALQWVISSGAAREMAFLNSWFFLELIVPFIQDLNALSQAIVGEVIQRIQKDPRQPSTTTLMLIKLDFLRIIASHEHFIVLNLPYGSSAAPQGMSTSHSGASFHMIDYFAR
ncbi:unnamed protein product [Gongylonema pulchrum]|uniref:Serine/threonine-protein kinase ATR n=1 Tax=Gongylonema pulchrum TaxID=637853 RepID=A0A183EFV5_9BILA|nr:unnamed protein product [Gongylonema pulchrum]